MKDSLSRPLRAALMSAFFGMFFGVYGFFLFHRPKASAETDCRPFGLAFVRLMSSRLNSASSSSSEDEETPSGLLYGSSGI
jgi:hypothetical protein